MRSFAPAAATSRSLAAYAAFFLSGGSSLIFQTIWTRMLHHVFGATSVAISTVLTVFMAGLGLGAWLGGRYANRIKHPIITYAIAETGVGLWGLLVPLLVRSDGWLATVNSFLRAELGADSGFFMVARFLCVAPILIVPTTLMGSTLPLLTRHFVSVGQDARSAGATAGVLYALNTFGAASGPILSAFVILPTWGLAIANLVACSMNFTLAAIIFLARRSLLEGSWKPGEPLRFWPEKPSWAETVEAKRAEEAAEGPSDETGAARAGDAPAEPSSRRPAKRKKAAMAASSGKRDPGAKAGAGEIGEATGEKAEPGAEAERAGERAKAGARAEAPIPELARKVAFVCFAASGAASLCYEVVWSRALAMTVGSSIYSFALILTTFLIGIAGGSAAMSAFLGERSKPFLGVAVTSIVLVALANVPWAIDIVDPADQERRTNGSLVDYLLLCGLYAGPIVLAAIWARRKARGGADEVARMREAVDWRPVVVVAMAAMPVLAAGINTMRFPGYLPQIVLSVTGAVAVFLVVASLLPRAPTLLLAIIQLFIAGATLVSYVWQDEIPRAFAQLVVSIPQSALPDHVATVKVFMWLTVVLCTLPATLGMGAMFPLTVRIWTKGGSHIASDVASVYTGNTIGSILGSWLPGFVLFALIGSERTLHLGIALNMGLALVMLIAGVADPDEDREFWTWRRFVAIGLPVVAALSLLASALPPRWHSTEFWLRAGGAVAFGALAVFEHAWLAARASGRSRGQDAAAWAMLLVPTTLGWMLGIFLLDRPPETAPWAARAVDVALRAVVLFGGTIPSWANHVECRATRGAEPAEAVPPARKSGGKKDKKAEADLPLWHAVTVYVLAPLIPALLAALWVGTQKDDAWLRWDRTHMTLGVFRLSYARDMLDERTWGAPSELVYYNDGLTTTVSVERWGRHYALKNNGKVDASNGDDMPTQINVAAYPLMLHPRGPEDLDVAIIGFGSGVSVGTALKFPVRRVDVIELEGSIIEAARFFEDVNHLEYTLDHWPYVEMDRLTIINDDGRNYLASTRQQYDVIISEPSNPWITGVSDLFTVDHWRITKQRLRPGGIYCQWVQLYELSPENIKTIYRTFASQFEHVLVLSADDRSSDTVMLGSDEPITLDLERLRRAYSHEGIPEELERANITSPFDVIARSLLANRDEVMQYTHIEYRRRGTERSLSHWLGLVERDRWVADPGTTNAGRCDPPQCRREPAVLNTDDNARIEFAAPNDLIGFARYEGYLGTIYSEQWPYGNPLPVLSGFGEGDEASRNYAELAMSMIAHGRYGWAGEMIERSQRVGRSRETSVALEVLTHLLTSDNEPPVRIEPPVPGPEMDRATAEQLLSGFDRVREAVDERAYAEALVAMENIPAPLRLHSGPGMRLLYGYLLYKAADGSFAHYRTAIEHLEDLLRTEEDYVLRHPEVYYFLARSYDANGDYVDALRTMRAYVEARLAPVVDDDAAVPEPAPGEAPTTDAEGESDKLEHADRG